MLRLASSPTRYTMLVDGTQSHPRGGRPKETHLEDLGLLLDSLGQEQGFPGAILYHTPLPLNASPRKCSSHTNYLIRMYNSSLFSQLLLMPEDCSIGQRNSIHQSTDFHPLVRSVLELRERVKEHIMFTNWDIFWGLGRVNLGAMSQWPQSSSSRFGRIVPPLGDQSSEHDTSFMEATTQTASPAMSDVELTGHITPPDRMEEENQYVPVITALIR